MKYGRFFFGLVLAGFLFGARPAVVRAALSDAQKNWIATRVETCTEPSVAPSCFTTVPTGTITYETVIAEWKARLQAGTVPTTLQDYYNDYTPTGFSDSGKKSRMILDLEEWRVAYAASVGGTTTTGTTTTGTSGTTTGTTTTTTAQGTLLSGMKKPSDYAADALDTSNFLQQNSETYGWSTQVWQSMRQTSNILIVVFLFLGALATTLNYNLNTYGIKRILPSVVQSAILANFSYLLINAAIEGVGMAQKGLLGLGAGDAKVDANTWTRMAEPLGSILKQLQPTSESTILNLGWGLIAALAVAVAILMLWLSVGILYLRSFVLALLVAFAPIAVLSMAFPATQGVWKKWWEEFSKWLLLPLIVCFWLMVASLISSVTALPLFLKVLVTMLAVFQGVRTPFTFKPAIAGAAIGYAAAKLTDAGRGISRGATGMGKDLGTRALYANNLTGGALRGYDRWKGSKAASLASLKDSKSVMRTPEQPTEDSSRWRKFMWNNGFRGRIGRNINAFFEGKDLSSQQGQSMNERQQIEAQARARAKLGLDGRTAGQRLAEHDLQKDRAQALLEKQKEGDQVTAAEANPQILQDIASLNESKEALANVMNSLKTGAQAAALASDKNLQAEKKLAEFRKTQAATMLKNIEASINSEAVTENTPLNMALRSRLGGASGADLRKLFESYGVHIKEDGSGYVEGMIQNELNATASTEAFESKVKGIQTVLATRDYQRHSKILKGFKDAQGNDLRSEAAIRNSLGSVFANDQERIASAEHLDKQLRSTLTPEQFQQYGLSKLVDTVRSTDPQDRAEADRLMARAVNIYKVADMNALARVPNVSDPVSQSELEASRERRIAMSLRQGKMMREDLASRTQSTSETTLPKSRTDPFYDKIRRYSPQLLNKDKDSVTAAEQADLESAVIATHALGKAGGEGVLDQRLLGSAYYELMNDATVNLRSWCKDAVSGDKNEPSGAAVEALTEYIDSASSALAQHRSRLDPQADAGKIKVINDTITGMLEARNQVNSAWTEYSDAVDAKDYGRQQAAKSSIRKAVGSKWLSDF